jgi:dUTP pyrophosphatase
MSRLNIYKIRDVKTPTRGTPLSAGIDFYVPNDLDEVVLKPGEGANIPSGIKVLFEEKFALVAFNKSGVSLKKGLQVGACVIDADYEGEVHLHVINIGNETQVINPGDKLVQFLLIPVEYAKVEEMSKWHSRNTERGEGGFGSTNKL